MLLLHFYAYFCFPIHSPIYIPFFLSHSLQMHPHALCLPIIPIHSLPHSPLPLPLPCPHLPIPTQGSSPIMNPSMFGSNNNTQTNHIALQHQEQHERNLHLHFPHPFLDQDDLFLTHILSSQHFFIGADCWGEQEQEQHHDQTKQNSEKPRIEVVKKKKKCSGNRKNGSSRKKTGKKDRHSKIYTAQGPRDRRMRLSLQIARKFFDLQDMLGFDKASNTIEWLLSNSTSAIKDLQHSLANNSGHRYGSVCCGSTEAVSEVIRDNNGGGGAAKEAAFMATPKHKQSRALRRVGRESRDRARARARQRTMLKKIKQPISNLQDVSSVVAISDDLWDFASIQSIL